MSNMTLKQCETCQHFRRLIAVGLGARCAQPDNQQYKTAKDELPVMISAVPSPCSHRAPK